MPVSVSVSVSVSMKCQCHEGVSEAQRRSSQEQVMDQEAWDGGRGTSSGILYVSRCVKSCIMRRVSDFNRRLTTENRETAESKFRSVCVIDYYYLINAHSCVNF